MAKEKHTLEVKIGRNKIRRYEFKSEEDKVAWEKLYRKSKLYIPYFLVGVGINLLLYFAGLDLSKNLLMGSIVGFGIPFASMYFLTELHYRLFINRNFEKR